MEQYSFKKSELLPDKLPGQDHEPDYLTEENKKLFCVSCKNYITDCDEAIFINGAHSHTFTNPAGFIYDIDCYRHATGCYVQGDSTKEYTWFGGYAWQIAVCNSCREQLGWLFSNDNQFYALISDRLTHTS